MNKALSWDDVCLIPQFSNIISRSDPDTSVVLTGKCNRSPDVGVRLSTPIISANMDTITESKMAIAMWNAGGIGVLHRFMPLERQIQEYHEVRRAGAECFVSLGLSNVTTTIRQFYAVGAKKYVIDVAHGHCVRMKEVIQEVRAHAPDILIMAGNVATPEAVYDLAEWGADIIKVGIGGGSICKTRIVTGHGVPMFTSVMECSRAADLVNVQIVADGGIKNSGDIVKAFVAGADAVMIGSLLSGTDETPGEFELSESMKNLAASVNPLAIPNSAKVKVYRGMASAEAQGDRQWGSNGVKVAPEGVSTYVQCKGPVEPIIQELTMGLKSGMSYCNARNLRQIWLNAKWREQSHSAYVEGTPHILKQ